MRAPAGRFWSAYQRPDILDDQSLVAARTVGKQRVLDLIGHALALIGRRPVEHGIMPTGEIGWIEKRREGSPRRKHPPT